MVPLEPGSQECQGVNMDCVHTLMMFMEGRLESVRERVKCSEETESLSAKQKWRFPSKNRPLVNTEITWGSFPSLFGVFFSLHYQGDKIKERLTPILNLLTESCRAHRETRHYLRKHVKHEKHSNKSLMTHLSTHNAWFISETCIFIHVKLQLWFILILRSFLLWGTYHTGQRKDPQWRVV